MKTTTKLTAGIYARYSTENQKDTSIEDQVRVCRDKATALGCQISVVHSDSATSGSTLVASRPGGRDLLDNAKVRKFDILLMEGLDRLSRDLVEQETIVRRLEHWGIRIVGVSDGYDSESGQMRKLARGVRGLINETYLADLQAKTHRGLAGQVDRGFHAGGISYGYRSVPVGMNDRGQSHGAKLVIDEEQADVVRRIFVEFGHGLSVQQIAHALNADGILAPRGGSWGVSVIYGNPRKGVGILNNELYVGRLVWNRNQYVKEPETHRRVRRPRPRDEWIVADHPDLRIVDDDTWHLVRNRLNCARVPAFNGTNPPNRTLLGGLLRCGRCGGAIIAVDKHSYGCAHAKDRGPTICKGMRAPRHNLHAAIVSYLQERLSASDVLDRIEAEAQSLIRDTNTGLRGKTIRHEKRIDELKTEVDNIVDAIAKRGVSTSLVERLKAAEAKLDEARAQPMPQCYDPQLAGAMVAHKLKDLDALLSNEVGLARPALREVLAGSTLNYEGERVIVNIQGCRIDLSAFDSQKAA